MQSLVALFPEVTPAQWEQLTAMAALHREWNEKINLVSRKDIENLERHHYAPCVAAVKFLKLMDGCRVMDVGTGGGFPGLILAVLYPKARFTLVDSVGKKITVVTDIAERLGLKNVDVKNARAETMNHEHDFVTGREEIGEADNDDLEKLIVLAGVKQFPMRVKCATLPWHTPMATLGGVGAAVTTQ